jgi:hypothetical protein
VCASFEDGRSEARKTRGSMRKTQQDNPATNDGNPARNKDSLHIIKKVIQAGDAAARKNTLFGAYRCGSLAGSGRKTVETSLGSREAMCLQACLALRILRCRANRKVSRQPCRNYARTSVSSGVQRASFVGLRLLRWASIETIH